MTGDPARPFPVRTRSVEVIAVGTRFDVANLASRTTVTMIEGHVTVRTISQGAALHPLVEAWVPGQQLRIDDKGQVLAKQAVKIDDVMAWRSPATRVPRL